MNTKQSAGLVINGWSLFAHPLFLDQVLDLTQKVEVRKAKHPTTYRNERVTKRLAAIRKLAFELIPQDPTRPEYRQGGTLGSAHKHWFLAGFFQQYRLFFRFHSSSKIIVYAWVNDEKTLRAYGSKSDAYRIFHRMLAAGNPPDRWNQLLPEAEALR